MARTLGQKLQYAATLDRRIDSGELLSFGHQNGGPLQRLGEAFIASTVADIDVARAVVDARRAGHSWGDIGAVLGTTGVAASKRYRGAAVDASSAVPIVQLRMPLRQPPSDHSPICARAADGPGSVTA